MYIVVAAVPVLALLVILRLLLPPLVFGVHGFAGWTIGILECLNLGIVGQ